MVIHEDSIDDRWHMFLDYVPRLPDLAIAKRAHNAQRS